MIEEKQNDISPDDMHPLYADEMDTLTPLPDDDGVYSSNADDLIDSKSKDNQEQFSPPQIPASCDESENKEDIVNDTMQIEHINEQLEGVSKESKQILSEIRELHKLYHNEYAGRLHSMQEKIDHYQQIENGRAFDGILSSIAQIYCNYENIADNIEDSKLKKSVRYLLLDLCELLESYGILIIHSTVGEKRHPQHCKIQERIVTNDPSLHDTIAKTYGSGFYCGNRTVIPERIDVYYYEPEGEKDSVNDQETHNLEE
jgi:molecular chaperone GrpE (heat shock protein)